MQIVFWVCFVEKIYFVSITLISLANLFSMLEDVKYSFFVPGI